jgi:enoyl-CoA hydratase
MPELETLLLSREGDIVFVTINRPAKLNALNEEVLRDLERAALMLGPGGDQSGARVVVITGAGGKAFVAGADIAAMIDMTVLQGRAFSELGHRVFDAIERLPMPVIAAVDGFALGGGMELAMACDVIYASDASRFGQPEVGLGVIPGFGGTQRLPRLVGPAKARELIFTGEIIRADEALRIGLVQAVFPKDDFMTAVMKRAGLVVAQAPLAVSQAKRAIDRGLDLPLERACELEQQAFGVLFATEDRREGMSAFVEKRKPVFESK